MNTNGNFAATLKQFVLGALDDDRRIEVEERLVTEPETFEALELVEAELVEAYAEDALSSAERQRFERHYLTTPERCQQVAFIRQLRARARVSPSPKAPRAARRWLDWRISPAWTAPLAASLCMAVGLSTWLATRQADLRADVTSLTAERALQDVRTRQLLDEVNRLTAQTTELQGTLVRDRLAPRDTITPGPLALAPQPPRAPIVYELQAGMLRSGGTLPRVSIPPDAATVHFRLPLSGVPFPTYRAVVYSDDGEELWSVSKLVPRAVSGGRVLMVVAPAELLGRGDYEIRVHGSASDGQQEPLASYSFRRPS